MAIHALEMLLNAYLSIYFTHKEVTRERMGYMTWPWLALWILNMRSNHNLWRIKVRRMMMILEQRCDLMLEYNSIHGKWDEMCMLYPPLWGRPVRGQSIPFFNPGVMKGLRCWNRYFFCWGWGDQDFGTEVTGLAVEGFREAEWLIWWGKGKCHAGMY